MPADTAPASDFGSILATLFPENEIVITDILGNEYKAPAAMSARRESRLLRVLERLTSHPIVGMAADLPTGAPQQQIQGLLKLLMAAIQENSGILSILEDAFKIAHPRVWEAVLLKRTSFDVEEEDTFGPADAFSIVEMATAILPFVVKPAQKILGAMKKAQTTQK